MMPRISPAAALLLSASAALFPSCRQPEIRTYLVPREATPPPAETTAETPAPPPPKQPDRPKPKVSYNVPEGWKEVPPGEVSLAAFALTGDGGEATVNVTALADLRGRELQVVNMYRQQTGQPPLEEAELGKTLVPVEVAGGQGQMFEFLGSNHDKPTRLITVITHRDGRSWFCRISGDDTFVTAQKTAFLDFLKTLHFSEPPANPDAASPEAAPKGTQP